MKYIVTIACILLGTTLSFGQTDSLRAVTPSAWTLQQCIDYALAQNLTVVDQTLNVKRAENAYQQDKFDRYPTLNASASHNYNFGRTIDPFTNQFVTDRIQSNNFSLTSGVTVYNGGRINSTILRSENEVWRSKLQSQSTENDIALAVADAFLNIIFAQNQLNNFTVIHQSTTTQLEQAKKLYEAGTTNQRQYLNLKAQDARDKMNIQNAEGAIRMAKLRLQQLMQLNVEAFEIVRPQLDSVSIEKNWSVAGIINNSYANLPMVRMAEMQLRSSELNIDIAQSAFYPRLSLFANINTLYSESRLERFNPQKQTTPIGYVEGTAQPVVTEFTSYDTRVTAFGKQLNENFGQAVGVSLSVPIFNANQVRANVSESKLIAMQSQNNVERIKFNLKADILQAYTDHENAVAAFKSALENESAQKENYDFVLKSNEAGVATTAELILALNDWSQAKNDLERARFQLIYTRTVLNFYNTGEIVLSVN